MHPGGGALQPQPQPASDAYAVGRLRWRMAAESTAATASAARAAMSHPNSEKGFTDGVEPGSSGRRPGAGKFSTPAAAIRPAFAPWIARAAPMPFARGSAPAVPRAGAPLTGRVRFVAWGEAAPACRWARTARGSTDARVGAPRTGPRGPVEEGSSSQYWSCALTLVPEQGAPGCGELTARAIAEQASPSQRHVTSALMNLAQLCPHGRDTVNPQC